jgi:hypothetical protein
LGSTWDISVSFDARATLHSSFCCTVRRAGSCQGWFAGGTHFRFAMATGTWAPTPPLAVASAAPQFACSQGHDRDTRCRCRRVALRRPAPCSAQGHNGGSQAPAEIVIRVAYYPVVPDGPLALQPEHPIRFRSSRCPPGGSLPASPPYGRTAGCVLADIPSTGTHSLLGD